MSEQIDHELEVMNAVIGILKPLDQTQRMYVLAATALILRLVPPETAALVVTVAVRGKG